MSADFDKAFDFIMKWEGGYVNHPKDPGGETKFGISKKSYPNLDIKNLTLEQAKEIYRVDYWVASGADKMEWPMSLVVFDTAVNMGVSRAKAWALTRPDVRSYIAARHDRYHGLVRVNSKLKGFLKGWMNRLTALKKAAGI